MYYHAKGNNKCVNTNLNKDNEKESYIISLNRNSLHASALSYELQFGELKFDDNIFKYTDEYISKLEPHGKYLYVLAVDLHYAKKLHGRDFDFPILCNQATPPNDKVKKLMSTFYDLHYITLHAKVLLKKGLKLKKIHYVIYAEQSDFTKSYITFNNEKRSECSIKRDKFGVDQCKLMNNVNFGKQMENVKEHKDTRIANNENKAKKLAGKVTFDEFYILSDYVTSTI